MDTLQIIALLETAGVGRKTVHSLLKSRIAFPVRRAFGPSLEKAERILKDCKRRGIEVLAFNDPGFPPRLKEIPDPPLILYAKGNLDCLFSKAAVAVVGTRRPTSAGRRASRLFGRWLAEEKIVVVSGLALGCDAEAHEGCLEARGQTVAFLPGGVSRVYPPQNRDLAKRILKFSGCLVSERPPEASPENYSFVERDRLQSGLSGAVVIVETDAAGGAMHTARFCLEEKKPLACLRPAPPRAAHPIVQGNLKLIRQKKAVPLGDLGDFERFVEANKPFL